ncbi:MAG TPA: serine hydrolase domain-containing protein [Candidatus Limnocylindrales bacterium]|nr:serine hydrolase domain-containing protein [Candidatus Limnocylindrales bacterium]
MMANSRAGRPAGVSPKAAGSTTHSAWDEVVRILDDAVGPDHVSPAASLLVGRGDAVLFEHATGATGPGAGDPPCTTDTIFDVASLTKPLVTAALAFQLIARGRLSFDTRVTDVLPDFASHAEGGNDERRLAVTVRNLLHHDSGLPAHRRYFESFPPELPASREEAARRRDRMFALALAEPLERDPRSSSVYSDIGFLVLGAMVEKIAGLRIDALAAEQIFGPLDAAEARFVDLADEPDDAFTLRCAATGACDWRRTQIRGRVQDQNAYAMGGVATHAGLFATARTIHRLAGEWTEAAAGRGRVLDRRVVSHAWDRAEPAAGAAPSPSSSWALGWDTPTPGVSSAGSRIGPGAVGHLGYTGTSLWIDPSRSVHVVLLTNRIAYGTNADAIRALRPRVHDAVFAALDRARD